MSAHRGQCGTETDNGVFGTGEMYQPVKVDGNGSADAMTAVRQNPSGTRESSMATRLRLLPSPRSRGAAARLSFAAIRRTMLRARAPGIVSMIVGAASVATGMLVVGGSLAVIVGAVVGALGIRWTLEPRNAGSSRRYEASGMTRPRTGRVTFLLRVWQNSARTDLVHPPATDPTMNPSSQSLRTRSHFTRLIDGDFGRGGPYLWSTLHQGGQTSQSVPLLPFPKLVLPPDSPTLERNES